MTHKSLLKRFTYTIGLWIVMIMPLQAATELTPSPATEVLYNAALQEKFNDFCTYVLRMQSQDEWSALLQDVKKTLPDMPTHMELYKQLRKSYTPMQPNLYAYRLYQALKYQQNLLGDQVKDLMQSSSKKAIDGYVEIGAPCRYADYINKHAPISGTRYAICNNTGFADVVENGQLNISRGFVPYDKIIPFNNYDPISNDQIADSSVDMVVCFIGLHHIPFDKIDIFIASIKRILRPGGVFLLRDHDAHNEEIFKLAYAAHTVFNAIIEQSSDDTEAHEIRNFQPLHHWIELLKNNGFEVGDERIVQQNDPTCNTMIKFIKPMSAQDQFLLDLHKEPGYKRYALQTFLTAPEWFNVDSAQSYGTFLDDAPWYEFPFLKNIEIYWYIFGQSWKQARATNSLYEILVDNDYFWTCMVIGTFMTTEYTIKSALGSVVQAITAGTYEDKINIAIKGLSPEFLEKLPTKVVIKKQEMDITVLEVQRYNTFQKTIALLAHEMGSIIEIGGQRIIQVKIKIADDQTDNSSIEKVQAWSDAHDAKLAYTWRLPTESFTYGSLNVPVDQLQALLRDAITLNFAIVYIHDF